MFIILIRHKTEHRQGREMPIDYSPERHGTEHAFIRDLIPIGQETPFAKEPESDYLARVKPLLPSFPADVLLQWFHRHGVDAHGSYDWLNYRALTFTQEIWSTDRVLKQVRSWPDGDLLDAFAKAFVVDPEIRAGWLGSCMVDEGSWPVPPIVLRNPDGLCDPAGTCLGQPFHLLEGHRRVSYFRAMASDPQWTLAPDHSLWLVTVDPSQVFAFWPLNDLAP